MSTSKPIIVRVVQDYPFSREKVFNAWFDPELIEQWMFGPLLRDEQVLHIETDPRVGGQFSFLVSRDGKELDHVGQYKEISPGARLVFTWGIKDEGRPTTVSVQIVGNAQVAQLVLEHILPPEAASYGESVQKSWTKMLSVLQQVLK